MNAAAQTLATTAKAISSLNPSFYSELISGITAGDFTDKEKLALATVILGQAKHAADWNNISLSVAKGMLEAALTSDFTEFGLPEAVVPTVDETFRTKVLTAVKATLVANLETALTSLAAVKAQIEAIEDEDLLATLTAVEE